MSIVQSVTTTFLLVAGLFATGCGKKQPTLPPFKPKPGSLELCIVANEADDSAAIEQAKTYFALAVKDPVKKAELKRLAEEGKPPPPPTRANGKEFSLQGEHVTYRWVELDSKLLRVSESNHLTHVGNQNALSASRNEGQLAMIQYATAASHAVWSRPRIKQPKEGEAAPIDYFILIRNAIAGKELTEALLEEFEPTVDSEPSRHVINGKLNSEGGKRMMELSRNNLPMHEGRLTRQIAIIIQGKVLTMPHLLGEIKDRFQVAGDFSEEEVKEVVGRVRMDGR